MDIVPYLMGRKSGAASAAAKVIADATVVSNYEIEVDAGEGQDFSAYNNAAVICKDTVSISQLPDNGDALMGATFAKRSAPTPQGYGYDASVTSIHNRDDVRVATTQANIKAKSTVVTITLGTASFLTAGSYAVILWRE